jgi:hypothetical protein
MLSRQFMANEIFQREKLHGPLILRPRRPRAWRSHTFNLFVSMCECVAARRTITAESARDKDKRPARDNIDSATKFSPEDKQEEKGQNAAANADLWQKVSVERRRKTFLPPSWNLTHPKYRQHRRKL